MNIKKPGFTEYYNLYKDKIYAYFWYRTGCNKKIAEDLTSEVFLKALKNIKSFDETRSFQSWIYAIAKNHIINYYKKLGREVSLEEVEERGTEPDKEIEIKFEVELVYKAMEKLPSYSRKVLLMRFTEGLKNEEIAAILEKDEGAIRTQISRSLTELRKLIKK